MTTVLHRHARELGYCNRGTREFFARHGMDWPTFLREGLPASAFEATGDAMALKLVKHAEEDSRGQ